MDPHNYYGENLEESEFGQVQALHLSLNAINTFRKKLDSENSSPGSDKCLECEQIISAERKKIIPNCRYCVECQTYLIHRGIIQ